MQRHTHTLEQIHLEQGENRERDKKIRKSKKQICGMTIGFGVWIHWRMAFNLFLSFYMKI